MKLDTEDKFPLGVKFRWVCSRCEGEDFEQIDNETCKCSTCGRMFTMDVLVHENRKREEEFFKEFRKAIRASCQRVMKTKKGK